jgi:hypothetical protein
MITNTVIDPTSTVLSKDGTTISYLAVGSGPPVMVIPGALSLTGANSSIRSACYLTVSKDASKCITSSVHTASRTGCTATASTPLGNPFGDAFLRILSDPLMSALSLRPLFALYSPRLRRLPENAGSSVICP